MGADIDWKSIIYRGVESDELDYKAAQNWLQLPRSGKAKFVRHCLAMANTKGGYVVVGVGEDASGQPAVFTGLTPEEAQSFDPTAVGSFINRYADPQIDFTLERPVVDRTSARQVPSMNFCRGCSISAPQTRPAVLHTAPAKFTALSSVPCGTSGNSSDA